MADQTQQPAPHTTWLPDEVLDALSNYIFKELGSPSDWYGFNYDGARAVLSRAAPSGQIVGYRTPAGSLIDVEEAGYLGIDIASCRPLTYAAPQPIAQQAEQPAEEARGVDAVGLDGLLCEHCGEGHTVLTFESGQFACNCDTCSADCQDFAVERLNALLAAPAAAEGPGERDRRDAERYRHVRAHGMPRLCPAGFYYHDGVFYPTADAAIDAYMAASKGEKA